MAPDRIDFAIIDELQNNARSRNKELAAKAGLAPSSCLARVRTLFSSGAIVGTHADVDPQVLGIGLRALISIRLVTSSRDAFQQAWNHLWALPEVIAIFNVSGRYDLQVEVVARDVGHLRDLVVDSLATHDNIGRLETSVAYSHDRKRALPRFA